MPRPRPLRKNKGSNLEISYFLFIELDTRWTIRSNNYPGEARLFFINRIIPDPDTLHFAKLFDLHMIVWGTGRVRTSEEYAGLLGETGWEYVDTRYPENEHMGAIEGVRA